MTNPRRVALIPAGLAVLAAAIAAGCGGSGTTPATSTASTPVPISPASSSPASAGNSSSSSTSAVSAGATPVGALTGESASLATGDLPDNQVFLTFNDPAAGWLMKYPEGWAQRGAAGDITFQDKNNLVHVTVRPGAAPTVASVQTDLATLASSQPSLKPSPPVAMTVSGTPMIKAVYEFASAPNPVTGKQVTLTVDRYAFSHAGKIAVVDLGTPKGVDNVDGYRLMIESFRWK